MTSEAAALTEQIAELLQRIDQGLWPHFDKKSSTWSSHHTANQHESESADCDPELCFETITICNGCGTQGCSEPLADLMREVRPILAARLADSRPAVSEAAITDEAVEAAAEALWPRGSAYLRENGLRNTSRLRLARAALTAALPHMSDGPTLAEAWDRLCNWLDAHVETDVRATVKRAARDSNPYRLSPTGDDTP